MLAKYKGVQADILIQMERHSKADESYYTEANKLLELASRAYEIFESSEADGKRELLKYLLQNSEMKGKKVIPTLQMPFDAILLANKTKDWLQLVTDVRTWYSNFSSREMNPPCPL